MAKNYPSTEVQKAFALEQIAPYAKDKSLCGYDEFTGMCLNLTLTHKMCVAGKNLLSEVREQNPMGGIMRLFDIYNNDQSKMFIPESVNILDENQWYYLQSIHDGIANGNKDSIIGAIQSLKLFTLEEFVALHWSLNYINY